MAISSKDKAEVLVAQFATNITLDTQGKQPPTIPDVYLSMTEIVFKHRTIRHILDGFNVNNSTEPDGILKKFASELTPVLWKLFSLSFATGIGKHSRVQRIFNNGNKTSPKATNIQLIKYLEHLTSLMTDSMVSDLNTTLAMAILRLSNLVEYREVRRI